MKVVVYVPNRYFLSIVYDDRYRSLAWRGPLSAFSGGYKLGISKGCPTYEVFNYQIKRMMEAIKQLVSKYR